MLPFPKIESRWEVLAAGLFVLGFLLLVAIYLSQPLYDPDLWWHLKTGELIANAKALLSADPFNYTGDLNHVSSRERTILDGYWLWEITAFGLQSALGMIGLRLVCLVTLLSMFAVVGVSFWFSRVRLMIALPLAVTGLILLQKFFTLERPSVWSFVFTALLMGFFVAIRRGARPSPGLYPMMAVWGNIHGGVVVGGILLGLFVLGSCWDLRHYSARKWAVIRWSLIGIALSFLNPNGIDFYTGLYATLDDGIASRIQEYQSTIAMFAKTRVIAVLWGLMLVHCWALWKSREGRSVALWLISLFLLGIGFFYLRNIAFVAVSLLPLTGFLLENCSMPSGLASPRLKQLLPAVLAGFSVVYVVTVTQNVVEDRKGGWWGEVNLVYPAKLADFMQQIPIKGNIFNNFDWGGYLIWRLFPQYKFFVDSRGINEQLVFDYNKITEGSLTVVAGQPEYEHLLDKYNIDVIVMNTEVENTGVNLLLKYLLTKPNWQPIYQDWQSYILVRTSGQSAFLLDRYRIDKLKFLGNMLAFFNRSIEQNPRDPRQYLGRGELLGYMGRYDEAARDFAMVKKIDPANPYLPAKLRQLEKLREQGINR